MWCIFCFYASLKLCRFFFVLVLNLFVTTVPVFSLPLITAVADRNRDTDVAEDPEIASPLVEDALTFVDRTHQYNVIPAYLIGTEYVKTANDNKNVSAYELDVTVSRMVRMYLFIDNRMGGAAGGLDV